MWKKYERKAMQKNTSINNKILFDIFNNEIAFPELNADSNKAVIFITDINKHKRNLIKLYTCLSNREKEQANKYRNVLLADRYVVAHGILRYILSYYCVMIIWMFRNLLI